MADACREMGDCNRQVISIFTSASDRRLAGALQVYIRRTAIRKRTTSRRAHLDEERVEVRSAPHAEADALTEAAHAKAYVAKTHNP